MATRSFLIFGMLLVLGAPAWGFETQDLKGSEALQRMRAVWAPIDGLAGEAPDIVDNWKAVAVNGPEEPPEGMAAAVKNTSGDILYMVKRKDNEIVATFVSSERVLFFPPFDFYVDKKHLFDAREKGMLPVMAGGPSQYSGFSFYLNKDFENPGANEALQAFAKGSQAVVEFLTVDDEVAQAAFSLKGSQAAIMEMLTAE